VVLDALNMAIWRRRPGRGLGHHSDQGSQYPSFAFGARMREAGIDASMGSVGDCFDNAVTEAFFATWETELIDPTSWPSRNAARVDLVDSIEGFHNADRLHSATDSYPPNEHEQRSHHSLTQPTKEPIH
jgi:transposase InsO family protein